MAEPEQLAVFCFRPSLPAMEFRKNFESFESLLWEPETALRGNVKNLALSNWTQLAIYQRDGSLALMTGPLRLSIALYLAQEEWVFNPYCGFLD
jgi:hypothetical protein